MRLAALFSGGKDSTYALYKAAQEHEIAYLVSIYCSNPESYMYHTSNIELTQLQARAMGIKLIAKHSTGQKESELQDLKSVLRNLDIDGIVCGAIKSKYQYTRIARISKELGLKLFTPLWQIDQEQYLYDLLKNHFEIIITAIAAKGFDKSWLGRKLDKACINELLDLRKKYGISIAGEGGEYESFVLDCPLFRQRIKIISSEKIWRGDHGRLVINAVA